MAIYSLTINRCTCNKQCCSYQLFMYLSRRCLLALSVNRMDPLASNIFIEKLVCRFFLYEFCVLVTELIKGKKEIKSQYFHRSVYRLIRSLLMSTKIQPFYLPLPPCLPLSLQLVNYRVFSFNCLLTFGDTPPFLVLVYVNKDGPLVLQPFSIESIKLEFKSRTSQRPRYLFIFATHLLTAF